MNPHQNVRRAIGLLLLAPALLLAASDGTKVVTRRGSATVTLDDVDAYVEVIPPAQRAEFVDSGKRVETMLQNLLMAQQLANEQRELEKTQGIDPLLAARLRFVENEARAQYHLAKLREQAPKVDAAALAREAYAAAPEKFRLPDTFDLRHVLIKTTDRPEPEARALIDKVHAEAVAHPDRFAELAKRYSEDQSNSANGGLLERVAAATLTPAFAEAAQALAEPGQVSPVVQTPYGLHVIQLVARHPGAQRSFESVQAELEAQVATESAGRWAQREIERLQNIPAQTDDTVANSIRTRYNATAPKAP